MNPQPIIQPASSLSAAEMHAGWADHPLAKLVFVPYPGVREFWIARDPSTQIILGRIGAYISPHSPEQGIIGFFDLNPTLQGGQSDAISGHLLGAACHFLEKSGCKSATGPIHYNTWFPYRFLLKPSDDFCFSWEPLNPPLWPELWRKFGFSVDSTFTSEGYEDLSKFAQRIKPHHQRALDLGFRFDPIDQENLLIKELPKLYELSMKGFSDAPFFAPISLELFRELYVPLANKNAQGQLRYSRFIVSPEGQTVGFSFNFVQDQRLILKTIAILPAARGLGLSNAAMFPGVEQALQEGVSQWVTALVRKGAQSESYGRYSTPLWRHEYALFSKTLSNF
ncbi:hypothetical protein EBZ37_06860 [bacterium]|nr:hypothetical protein [bacterium]